MPFACTKIAIDFAMFLNILTLRLGQHGQIVLDFIQGNIFYVVFTGPASFQVYYQQTLNCDLKINPTFTAQFLVAD